MSDSCEVAVIGAGLSGLTAAYQLRDTDVVVLEADDHIGGRSQRTELAGWPTTTGGEGWYDPNPDSPESRLLAEVGIKTTPVPGTPLLHTADGRNITLSTPEQLADDLGFSAQARPDFLHTFTRVAEVLDVLGTPDAANLIPELLVTSGADWIGPVHAEVVDYYRRIAGIEMGVSLEADSAFSMLTGMPAFGGASVVWGDFLLLEGGAPMIGQAMASRLQRPPVTGALVTSVAQNGSRVEITYRHAGQRRTLDADHVVMATPHPVTAQLVRGLSSTRRSAMDAVRTLPIVEVLVLLADGGPAPWDALSALWTMDKSFSVGLNSRTHHVAMDRDADKHSVIKMIAVGPSAVALADRSDSFVVKHFIDDLAEIFPAARDKVAAHSIKRWMHGIPAPSLGFDRHLTDMITPFGAIHFAGDWCGFVDIDNPGGAGTSGDWGGYGISGGLHPAVRAGMRAACEVRASTFSSNGAYA